MKAIVVLSNANAQCATFFFTNCPAFYIGYRFIEHVPDIRDRDLPNIDKAPSCSFGVMPCSKGVPLPSVEADPWHKKWIPCYEEKDPANNIQLSFQSFSDGSASSSGLDNSGRQKREFYFKPVDNGVLMWMRLTTKDTIGGSFGVQQCLRYSGSTNLESRQTVAFVPFLSEFDMQANGKPNKSLTFARKENRWIRFPIEYTVYHTAHGDSPTPSESTGEIDHGLIVRESTDHKYASGMYWERSVYVSNRHPADCLHSSVDFGPLDAGSSRTNHGKFYFINGTKDDILEIWRKDFPINNTHK